MEGTEIRDVESNAPLNWGDIFFTLHKHCHLNKWEIWEYTLPQIAELMKLSNQYIQFEVETRLHPFGMMTSVSNGATSDNVSSAPSVSEDPNYHEVTEDDLNLLARALGGF